MQQDPATRYTILMNAIARGHTVKEAAAIALTSLRTASRWVNNGPPGVRGRKGGEFKSRAHKCAMIARRTFVKGGKRHPRFPSAPRVAEQLFKEFGIKISSTTVLRDLRSLGWSTRVRPRHPNLTSAPKRLAFAQKWIRNGRQKARRLVFSDEHYISTNDSSLRTMLVAPRCLPLPREHQRRHNVPHFLIWAAIGFNWRSPLIFFPKVNDEEQGWRMNSRSYIRRCLSRVKSHLCKDGVIFMQDGARCHWGKNVVGYMDRSDIAYLVDFPPGSPDLNPIEQLWAVLNRRIAECYPETDEELKAVAIRVWAEIPQQMINNFVESFSSACRKVVQNRGK